MEKTCLCYIGNNIENTELIKNNSKTVIVLFKGKYIKRHKIKHYVEIKNG